MNNRGFTLVEAWLVLAVLSAIVVVSQLAIIQPFKQFTDAQILAQFRYDLTLTQVWAMHHGQDATFDIKTRQKYELRNGHQTITRILPSDVAMEHTRESGRTFAYSKRGTPRTVGKFIYVGASNMYDVKIQFGRGRVDIVER